MKKSQTWGILKHPFVLVISVLVGVLIGLYAPQWNRVVQPLGHIFLSLLKMCAFPIVITAVATSLGGLFRSKHGVSTIEKMVIVFALAGVLSASLGVVLGHLLGTSFVQDASLKSKLSVFIANQEAVTQKSVFPVSDFFMHLIPENIFRSLTEGEFVSSLLFIILFSISFGLIRDESGKILFKLFEGARESLFKMMDWIMYLLPFGLCAIIADNVARFGSQSMSVFLEIILYCCLGSLFLISLHFIILSILYKRSLFSVMRDLKDPIVVALSTSSSLAALPSLLMKLQSQFKMKEQTSNLVVPIELTFHQASSLFFFPMILIVVAHIYSIQLGPMDYFLIVMSSYIKIVSTVGMPAVASLSILEMLIRPLGIPVEMCNILIVAIIPLTDPILTLANVTGYSAGAALIEKWDRKRNLITEPSE